MPTEELIRNGFAVLSFGYEDVTRDDGDFTSWFLRVFCMRTANARRMTRVKSHCGRGRRCAAWITPSTTSGWTAQSPLCAGIRALAKRHC